MRWLIAFIRRIIEMIRRRFFMDPAGSSDSIYLSFTCNSAMSISASKIWDGIVEYSTDQKTWQTFTGAAVSIDSGTIYFRGIGNTSAMSVYDNSWKFTTNGASVYAKGNLATLLDYATVENGEVPPMASVGAFAGFFRGQPIETADIKLPWDTINQTGFRHMFAECTRLTIPPRIPATTYAGMYSCMNMFYGCNSLQYIPAINARVIGYGACENMFNGTNVSVQTTQDAQHPYKYRIPMTGSTSGGSSTDLSNMFGNTSGSVSTPTKETDYYISIEPLLEPIE